ncbi:MAG: cyclic nucleotide-binding domain-containing protein [Myxococcales bacterium]|nr:cyclic nucleotide-binding domain-containing protein [Myxococcales bacterium]
MRTTAHIHAEADTAAHGGNFRLALALVTEILRLTPSDHRARLKVGLCLAALGRSREGASVVLLVARGLSQRGYVLAAVGACRDALHLEPTHPGVQPILENLYDVFGGYEGRCVAKVPPSVKPTPVEEEEGQIRPDAPDLIERARAIAMADPEPGQVSRERFQESVPFFSDLGREAFLAVVHRMKFHKQQARTFVVRQGDPGTSLFIIVSGQVEVSIKGDSGRSLVLTTLGPGELFGEMSLLTERVRVASVQTLIPVELFEIDRTVLEAVARRHPSVLEDIVRFAKKRMIKNLMGSSSVFRALEDQERLDVIRAFETLITKANEVVIEYADVPKGLYLILEGELKVSIPNESGEDVILGYLSPGKVAGEIALLDDSNTTARVTAVKQSVLMYLPKTRFFEIVAQYPRFQEYLGEMSVDRLAALEGAEATGNVVDPDEMVLI